MKALLLAFVALCGTLHAGEISVTLNFNVNLEYLYASGEYNPLFTPETITATATFDDSPTSRASDPHDVEIYFGAPFVSSPLTPTLPYGPATTTIGPSLATSDTLMTSFNFGAGDAGSYFQIQSNQSSNYGDAQSWIYGFSIAFPGSGVIPPLSNASTFSGDDLVTWLKGLQASQTSLVLNEYSYNLDDITGQYWGGIGYVGEGVITGVNSTPEPASATLIGVAFVGLIVFVRRRRAKFPFSQRYL
jgi:hypothetical protein